jgi:two-component system chemotaxis response regulator CheB
LPRPDIIVVGASAGGVEALQILGAGLPANLPAAVFVVLHVGNGTNGRSELPKILENAGSLPAKHPVDGESIVLGTIYVAPPDYHLLVSAGNMHLSHGPKENWTRPAINPLFRSAAHT